jgi:hypothetical protein
MLSDKMAQQNSHNHSFKKKSSLKKTTIIFQGWKESKNGGDISPSSIRRCIALFSSSIACILRPLAERDLSSGINGRKSLFS